MRTAAIAWALTLTAGACSNYLPYPKPHEVARTCRSYLTDSTSRAATFLVSSDTIGDFRACWYSVFLRAFHEPDLRARWRSGPPSYRLLWLPTFDHPVSVRIELRDSGVVATVVTSAGAGGYEPGRVTYRDSFPLGVADWERVTALADSIHFWAMPMLGGRGGLDGSQWIIEGVPIGRYHLVDHWTPLHDQPFFQLGYYLLKLSKLPLDSSRVY